MPADRRLYQITEETVLGGIDGFTLILRNEVPAAALWAGDIWLSRFKAFQLIKDNANLSDVFLAVMPKSEASKMDMKTVVDFARAVAEKVTGKGK